MTDSTATDYVSVQNSVGHVAAELLDRVLRQSMMRESPVGIEPEKNGGFSDTVNFICESYPPAEFQEGESQISLKVGLFKPKSQEGLTGADYAIIFEVFDKNDTLPTISKTTLVQAKVGNLLAENTTKGDVSVNDKHCKGQLQTIDHLTPNDGFLLIYTDQGCYSILAREALACHQGGNNFVFGHGQLDTAGAIVSKMAACTKGNVHAVSPIGLNVIRKADHTVDLDDFKDKLTAYGVAHPLTVIQITTTLNPTPRPPSGPRQSRRMRFGRSSRTE